MDNGLNIGFVLPHAFYWGWLLLMPLAVLAWSRMRGQLEPVPHPPGSSRLERMLDWISDRSGLFVALWTVNAVFAYTYEVIARYLFDQPSIWVHEASFLLFGMQYVLAGAYGLLHGAHVRVDVIYTKLKRRTQAAVDIFNSLFFFAFVLVMLGTAWRFFRDSLAMDERSLETWQVHFWPVKAMLLLGAFLILLAGVSRLLKDIRIFEQQLRTEEA